MRKTVESDDAVPASHKRIDERAELCMFTTPPVHEVNDRSLTPHAATYGSAERRRLERRPTVRSLKAAA